MQLIHKQVINHTQAAYKLRITHNLDICIIEDQLSGRVPDKEVEPPALATHSKYLVNNLCPHDPQQHGVCPQHHGMQPIHKQVINHTQAAYKSGLLTT